MTRTTPWLLFVGYLLLVPRTALPGDLPGPDDVRESVGLGLRIVQKAARNYPTHRDCFSCHHQTLPMLAMASASEVGIEIDEDLLQEQAEFTHSSFESRIEDLKAGKNIGGRAMTVSYGLLALELARHPSDEVTTAMVTFLLKTQDRQGHWSTSTRRPPLEESRITSTVLSMNGIDRYATAEQRTDADRALGRARRWLLVAPATHQEDRVARLWAYQRFGFRPDLIDQARVALLTSQRDDGGWSQEPEMASDAYATGQALAVLARTGLPPNDPAFQRGARFLVGSQREDGSWYVKTRAKPVQVFFDNGDPHGENQFIAVPATAWAVTALTSVLRPAASPIPLEPAPAPR